MHIVPAELVSSNSIGCTICTDAQHQQNFYTAPKLVCVQGRSEKFLFRGSICVANLLVYTNFYIHIQTHVSIHTQKINIFHSKSLKLNISWN